MAEAAAALHLSPSALSQSISELERKLGLELFERRGRARVLTENGRRAVDHGDRVLAAARDLGRWSRSVAAGTSGQVRLGLIDLAAVSYYPDTLLAFRADRPDIELRLTVGASATLLAQVEAGDLDAAVLVEPAGPVDDVELTELLTEPLAIYRPSGDGPKPPGAIDGGRPDDPATWGPWVTFPPSSHTRRHVAAALRDLGAEFRIEAESHQPEVLRQLVSLGMGWTVLPVGQAETEPNPLVRATREPLLTRRLLLARRRTASAGPATADLIERLIADAPAAAELTS